MDELESYGLQHFKLHPLAEGVYAAIAENGGQAISNAGLVDLGGQVIVFDTFLTPQAAVELRRFAIDRFGQVSHIIINSHYHNDHIWGNQVFASRWIDLIQRGNPPINRHRRYGRIRMVTRQLRPKA
jgi:glyoxylase-like metal-dependent hydrolase (beta-lactamase superfamily II)